MTLAFVLFLDLDPSDTSPLVAALTPAWLADCAADVQNQLRTDVAPYWPDGAGATMRVGSGPTDIGLGEIAFAICSTLANAPGAEAYHDVGGNAVPIAFLALDTCASLDDVSSGISHECAETAGDSECNLFADDTDGNSYARELCDAVQASGYRGRCVQLSDFVLPSFFAPSETTGPYHFLATKGQPDLPGPFATQAGGYQIVRVQGTGETQVTGSLAKIAKAKASRSRMHRRGVRPPTKR